MKKKSIRENSFDGAPGGTNGSLNYQTPLNTHDAPNTVQDPDKFNTPDNNNKALGSTSNTAKDVPDIKNMDAEVKRIFSKKVKPTPDEVKAGLDFEMHNMIKPDKLKAKELVLQNLRKDPKFYGKLRHLNIDDEHMDVPLPVNEVLKNVNVEETKKIFDGLVKKKDTKYVVNSAIADVMRQLIEDRKNRRAWQKGDPTL